GFKVLRADDIGHKVLEREDVKKKVIAIFGDDILDSKGKILRKKLRSKVVIEKDKLFMLNTLLHPLIKKELWSELENYSDRVIFVEAALIFEAGWDFFMDRVITVYSPRNKQIERLKRNTDLSIEEINSLLGAQLSQEEKIRRADFVIPNERDLKELEINTRRVLDEILEETKGGYKG
ncbi:dephospho-CoA kinase, partial [Candidatus Aerophobetes bacterium]|nr:dephospho-CoA kinase [Candidatus Aerophobetes bacterium]